MMNQLSLLIALVYGTCCHLTSIDTYYRLNEWESLSIPALFRSDRRLQSWKVSSWVSSSNNSFWENLIGNDLNYVYFSNHSNIFPYYDTVLAKRFSSFRPEYQFINLTRRQAIDALTRSSPRNQPHFDTCISKECIRLSSVGESLTGESFGSTEWIYYSGNIHAEAFHSLRENIDISNIIDDDLFSKVTVLVWLGSIDVSASPHYDAVNNIYIQLYGQKTFRLQSPVAIHDLYIYGRYHPYACQSRYQHLKESHEKTDRFERNFCALDDDLKTNSSPVDACQATERKNQTVDDSATPQSNAVIEFTLQPGDIAYIPAFWLHEAKADTASASLSLWWDSYYLQIMDEVYAMALPFESTWSKKTTVCVTIYYFNRLVAFIRDRIHTVNQFDVLVKMLLKNRYEEDWIKYGAEISSSFSCRKEDLQIDTSLLVKLNSSTERLTDIFLLFLDKNPESEKYSQSIAILAVKLADYIEDVFTFIDAEVSD